MNGTAAWGSARENHMASTDAFSAQIVELVRKMSDEAILELVKHQLGAALGVSPLRNLARSAPGRGGRPTRVVVESAKRGKRGSASAKRRPGRPRKTASLSEERQETLNNVERVVKASSGVSASDVARSASIPQTRAAAALKELKLAKRIFQGGDRRFARYAGDAKQAELASTTARKSASGPTTTTGKKAARVQKRGKDAVAAK
ncbi:MAG: hypothetical protein ABI193_27030 [Minicystis sp.]